MDDPREMDRIVEAHKPVLEAVVEVVVWANINSDYIRESFKSVAHISSKALFQRVVLSIVNKYQHTNLYHSSVH